MSREAALLDLALEGSMWRFMGIPGSAAFAPLPFRPCVASWESSGPSEDPAEDKKRSDEYDPEVYVINVELHRMIVEADQAAGIVMEAADEEEEEEE